MRLFTGLLIALVFALLLKVPLKRFPIVFYLLAVALDVLLLYGTFFTLPV
ncbi:MAG: hypothetical protein LBG81_05360 [Coriobacteriaceae bacterium]|jgi:hypothetical protein|nr:hypothetical protein [Coriobacteriaceae bacterium]